VVNIGRHMGGGPSWPSSRADYKKLGVTTRCQLLGYVLVAYVPRVCSEVSKHERLTANRQRVT
jgi:hypothetical protein